MKNISLSHYAEFAENVVSSIQPRNERKKSNRRNRIVEAIDLPKSRSDWVMQVKIIGEKMKARNHPEE